MATFPEETVLPQAGCGWPPQYILRYSVRAKRLGLQISKTQGLEVVIPKKRTPVFLQKAIENLLNEHRPWVEKNLSLWAQNRQTLTNAPFLPEKFYFSAWDQALRLHYQPFVQPKLTLKTTLSDIILKGPVHDTQKCVLALKRFLKRKGETLLLPLLKELSIKHGFIYQSAHIRHMSTLWGSCNAVGGISLNSTLLFLPRPLIEYVMLHELCHLKFLNHSRHFWNLLKKFDPLCFEHRKALRSASHYIPRFLEEKHKSEAFT